MRPPQVLDDVRFREKRAEPNINGELGQQIFRLSNLTNVILLTNDGEMFYDLGFELYPENRLRQSTAAVAGSQRNAYWTGIRTNRGSNRIRESGLADSGRPLRNLQSQYETRLRENTGSQVD